MSRNSEKVKAWRKRTKDRIVEAFGNICCVCGKQYPSEVYDLHHLVPSEKEFALGSIRANSISWKKIVVELRKCILVCSNCHRLVHCGIRTIPENCNRFDEGFSEYRDVWKSNLCICPVCGEEKRKPGNFACSVVCSRKRQYRVDWESIDLIALYNELGSYVKTGEFLNVSDNSVRKRIRKLVGERNDKN